MLYLTVLTLVLMLSFTPLNELLVRQIKSVYGLKLVWQLNLFNNLRQSTASKLNQKLKFAKRASFPTPASVWGMKAADISIYKSVRQTVSQSVNTMPLPGNRGVKSN
jgi:hypothetical protein